LIPTETSTHGVPPQSLPEWRDPAEPEDTEDTSWKALAVSTAACALLGLSAAGSQSLLHFSTLGLILYVGAYLAGGWEAFKEAGKALVHGKLEVDLLMVLAAMGAALLGHWAEGAILLFLFSLGNTLESYAFGRTRRSIMALMELRPDTAHKLDEDGESELLVPIESLLPGDRIRVRPGERIPMDGRVVAGESPVDEATLTGEAIPLRKQVGDEVFAGTLNTSGTLDLSVTRRAADSTLARVIRLVEEAREAKAPAQSWIEKT
jgi:Cd2+/Zn2+-exporting ATPase